MERAVASGKRWRNHDQIVGDLSVWLLAVLIFVVVPGIAVLAGIVVGEHFSWWDIGVSSWLRRH